METMNYEEQLSAAGIRITAVRLLIWRTLQERMTNAFSLSDVQDVLYTVDKSTLFRALTLFAEHELLHTIDDGSGMQKYCVCRCEEHGHVHDGHRCGHIHMTCTVCHKTWCIEDIEIPPVSVPEDFMVTEREYIVKGVCKACRRKGSLSLRPSR